jgi:hypothetical protein
MGMETLYEIETFKIKLAVEEPKLPPPAVLLMRRQFCGRSMPISMLIKSIFQSCC